MGNETQHLEHNDDPDQKGKSLLESLSQSLGLPSAKEVFESINHRAILARIRTSIEVQQGRDREELKAFSRKLSFIGDSLGFGMVTGTRATSLGHGVELKEDEHPMYGSNLSEIEAQLDRLPAPTKKPYLIIQGGTNELDNDPKEIVDHLVGIYKKTLKEGFKPENVTLVTIPPHKNNGKNNIDQKVDSVNELLRTETARLGINLCDLNAEYKKVDPDLKHLHFTQKKPGSKADGIHYCPKGYDTLMAIALNQFMTKIANPQINPIQDQVLNTYLSQNGEGLWLKGKRLIAQASFSQHN